MARTKSPGKLQKLSPFIEDIVNTVRESLLVLDSELKVIYANKSFFLKFKVKPEQTINRQVYDLGNRQWNIPELRKLLEEILLNKKAFNDFEVDHVFQDIGHKIMLLNGREVVDRENGDRLILLAIQDITEYKRMLNYTLQAAKLSTVGQLSAGVAHGLNSPLTGIYNFLQVYYKTEKDPEKKKELELMLEACKYMAQVVKNLTYFSSKTKDSFTKVNLIDVVESTLLFTERQLAINDIEIVRDFPKKVSKVKGNKAQLQHVLLNIIMNSKEAIKHSGKIIIRISEKNDSAVLEIIDKGIGIPKKDLLNIFAPFFTTKSESGGVGLGLSAAYGIIKAHNGSIDVKSKKGTGTTVTITLPIAK